MLNSFTIFLVLATTLLSFNAFGQAGPPPRNLQFDSLTLVATWEPPRSVVLDEHFEGADFPPQNWQDTTQGVGWFATTNGSSTSLNIPPHTTYAVVNNSLAGTGNNGCCDYLITPEMDLTHATGYTLSFNSFFRGLDAETASVEISTDGGTTWMPMLEVLPHFAWANLTVDLGYISGSGGAEHVKIAFKANDNGIAGATGWAVDDVVVMSDAMEVQGYAIFWDGTEVGQTSDTTYTIQPEWFPNGFPPNFCIATLYESGFSVSVCADFPAYYLAPPTNFQATVTVTVSSVAAILNWLLPLNSDSSLLSFTIYRDNTFLVNVPKTETQYWDIGLAPGMYCYSITALYDLTNAGFPGQVGESKTEGPACVDNSLAIMLPFLEDWTTGYFDINHWTVGSNWLMDVMNGDPKPAAMFLSQPAMTSYSCTLTSFYLNAGGFKTPAPNCQFLDFDYFLDDISASGTEKLTVEISDGDTWIPVKELSNNGDMGWTQEHINITTFARNKFFRVRFDANGVNSTSINYWMVDNIHLYPEYSFIPPANFSANNTGNTQQNEIQLDWDIPLADYLVEVFEDDSTYENSLGINPGYAGWLGNKLNAGKGTLRAAEIWWQGNGGTLQNPVFVDVFDTNRKLLGSSDAFVPIPGTWQLVALPDVALDGDFYTMVRFERQPGTTAMLGMDSTTNSGRPNAGWYYDGSEWSQLNAFGLNECVFSIHAVVKKEVDCENNVIEKSFSGKYPSLNYLNTINTKSASGTSGQLAYEVYRREYQVPIPGQDSLLTDWQKIATLSANSYLDQNLDFKCYQYYVEAFYDEGSSIPSNRDEACFLVGMNDPNVAGIKLYPNPVKDFLTIETNGQIEQISVFSSSGIKVSEIPASNGLNFRLDVSTFSPGIYSINFTTINGESFSKKFVKT